MRKRVDDNTAEIVRTFRKLGATWISTTGDPSLGFDGLLVYRSRVEFVEIKDGSKPPSARQLTTRERARQLELEAQGCCLNVIETIEDALRLVAAMR